MAHLAVSPHSCKKCKNCISKKNVKGRVYYYCKYNENLITDSVYESNECLVFNSK